MANNEKIIIDARKAIEAISALEKETAILTTRKDALIKIQTRLEAANKTETKEYKNSVQMLKENSAAIKSTSKALNEQINNTNVAQLSYNQLNKLLPKLRAQFYATNKSLQPENWETYKTKLQDAEKQMKVVSGRMDIVKEKMTWKQSVGAGLKSLGPSLGVAGLAATAVAKAGEFLAGAWDRAKSVQTEAAKAARVFGSELGYVEMQAEKVASRAGLTNKEFVAMATNTADLLIPMGFTRKTSAEMAVDMQKLTGALVEWSNGKFTAEDVSMRLTKAMMGETEGLKELGIGIRKDSDEYKKLVKEKEKGEGVTKAQAEALATLELVMAKSVDAQTEYAESGFNLMKFGRQLSLTWRELTETVAIYIATSKEDRMEEQARKVASLNSEFATSENKLNDLLPRYDALKEKSKLSKEEQEELRVVVKGITSIVPEAVNAWEADGKAIGINTEIVRGNISARKALLQVQNKAILDDLSDNLKDNISNVTAKRNDVAIAEKSLEKLSNAMKTNVRSSEIMAKTYEYESKKLLGMKSELSGLEDTVYNNISAQMELGHSFEQTAQKGGTSAVAVEKMYRSIDRKKQPTNYNDDGSAKTADQLAAEEAERVKQKKLDDEKEAKRIKDGKTAEDAKKEAKNKAKKDAEQKIKDAEKAIEDQKKLEQDIKDTAIALSEDELRIEQDRYDKKLQALKLYGVDKATMTADQLAAVEGLEREHQKNVDKIEDTAISTFLSKVDTGYKSELTALKTAQAEELGTFSGTAKEKEELLKKHLEALKELNIKSLSDTASSITQMLSGENLTGLSDVILSDEQKEALNAKLAEVKLQLAEITGTKTDEPEKAKDPFEIDGSSTDVLGMTPDTWGQLQANLKNGTVGIGEMVAMAKALSAAFGMYNDMATANEKKQLAEFEKNNDKKKDALKRRLESGAISQEEYNAQVASLDEELDAKKHEMEVKQAKRDKVQALFDIAISTAVGIASALKTPWLIAMISAIGAVQIATVLATPLPGKEKGGFLAEREDGKKFDAEYAPAKRGYITKPTVITGENGSEYVIPADGMRNPSIASVVSMIENARLRGNIKDVNLNPTPKLQGREQGGFVASNTIAQRSSKDDTSVVLTRVATVLERLESRGVKASIPLMGNGGIVQQLDKVFKIQKRTTI